MPGAAERQSKVNAVSWIAAFITAASLTGYHVMLKIMPPQTNAAIVLFGTYFFATTLSFLLLIFYPGRLSLEAEFAKLTWAAVWPIGAFGLAVFGIEFGYLLAYRSGWKLSTASATMNTVSTALLFGIAMFAFQEEFSIQKLIGVLLATGGVLLMK